MDHGGMNVGKQAPSPDFSLRAEFDDHAVAIARRQYFQPGADDLAGTFERVANWVASPEGEEDREVNRLKFFDLMASKRFCPGGRVLAGAATSHGNVLNCFVQDGKPEAEGTTAGVLHLATKLALVTKVGGGNGLNLDPLPPRATFDGEVGTLYLTIRRSHDDYEKVRDGTFMDLVHGQYGTRGYRFLNVVEYDATPAGASVLQVEDSVEGIWRQAGRAVELLLDGQDVLIDLSDLRAEGTVGKGSGGTSSGPSSFAVEIYDNFGVWASMGGAEYAGPVATLRYIYAPTLRAIRQGGCLHPDTLVNTSRGTLRLSELVDSHQMGWQDHHLKVATDEGWKDSPRGFNNGNAPTLRVTLGNGQTLRGTPNHRVKVMRENGNREWVKLEDLQAGDHVIQVLDQHTGAPVLLRPVDSPHHNAKPIEMPEILGEKLAFFLGYLWGDGFISGNRVGFSVSHGSPMMEEAPRLFRELFGLDVSLEQKPDDGSVVFVTRSAQLVAWLDANGLGKAKARTLQLPKAIRMAPRPVVGSFLKALFEADGSITHGMPTLSTASAGLAEDVATMLAGLGIPTKRRTTDGSLNRYSRHAIHSIRVVSAKGLERFLERVGVMAGSRLEAAGSHVPDEAREKSWILPHTEAVLGPVFAELPAGVKGSPSPFTSARKNLSRYIRGDRNLTATAYDRLRLQPELAQRLPEFGYDEYYVPVHNVTQAGRSLTLDISVDENKTYLAGGCVTHNTRRGAGMATMSITHPDIQDFITAKDLDREQAEGDISTFNISVLVTDHFMEEARKLGKRTILDDIAEHAWQTGEPGVIFVDRINEFNPMREALGDIMATNPCVPADTWVMTRYGARQVHELVGEEFCATVDGKCYQVTSNGFFSTGVKPVLRVRTKRGYELRLTGNHQLKRVDKESRYQQETSWVAAEELQPGDRISLQNHREAQGWSGKGSENSGWLLGLLVGDGTFQTDKSKPMACLDIWGDEREELSRRAQELIRKETHPLEKLWVGTDTGDRIRLSSAGLAKLAQEFGIVPGSKTVTDEVEKASREFYRGFLRGLFDADGSVQGTQEKGVSVRLAQSDLELLRRVQRMLARLGIMSTLYEGRREAGTSVLPDGKGGTKAYPIRAQHELVISNDNLQQFSEVIGFGIEEKAHRLEDQLQQYRRTFNRERFSDVIVEIVPDGEEEVFDITVDAVQALAR